MHARVATPAGLELALSDWRGDGRPVLFVHGFGHDRHVWEDIAQGLPEGERPIAHDLRGHGDSDWSLACDYRADDHADDIASLLDALGIERVRLVGHSLGGNASTLFSAAHPERVEALVLVDTGPALSAAAWRFAAADAGEMARAYADVAEYRKLLALAVPLGAASALDRLARTSLIRRLDGRFEPKQDPILLELTGSDDELRATEARLWDALAKLRCPVLVARGERSAMLPEAVARRMVDEVLGRGQLVRIPRAGHAVPIENGPDLLAEMLRFFAALD
jgi:pimeloyl-ACP methyl ester carboxylesterase